MARLKTPRVKMRLFNILYMWVHLCSFTEVSATCHPDTDAEGCISVSCEPDQLIVELRHYLKAEILSISYGNCTKDDIGGVDYQDAVTLGWNLTFPTEKCNSNLQNPRYSAHSAVVHVGRSREIGDPISFTYFQVDTVCEVEDTYEVVFGYSVDTTKEKFDENAGRLQVQFNVDSYDATFENVIATPKQAGTFIYLGITVGGKFNHADRLWGSDDGKIFAPKKCVVRDIVSNFTYLLFDVELTGCGNDEILLTLGYKPDIQMWTVQHLLFLLGGISESEFIMSCVVHICDVKHDTSLCAPTINACFGVDGGWSEFGDWSNCTATCGGGSQIRTRTCSAPAPDFSGSPCNGVAVQNHTCNTHSCPIDGNWAGWGSWTDCSKTCGFGIKRQLRTCSDPVTAFGGVDCVGIKINEDTCGGTSCPVNGGWGPYGGWSECKDTCDFQLQERNRTCDSPVPANNGTFCSGLGTEERTCNVGNCTVHGNWGSFGNWTTCSKTCGSGVMTRERLCNNPAPDTEGFYCDGKATEEVACNTKICSVIPVQTLEEVNECLAGSCSNNHTCHDLLGDYGCGHKAMVNATAVFTCDLGWSGKNCDIVTNPCDANPCDANGSTNCTMVSVIEFECSCKEGYRGQTCSLPPQQLVTTPMTYVSTEVSITADNMSDNVKRDIETRLKLHIEEIIKGDETLGPRFQGVANFQFNYTHATDTTVTVSYDVTTTVLDSELNSGRRRKRRDAEKTMAELYAELLKQYNEMEAKLDKISNTKDKDGCNKKYHGGRTPCRNGGQCEDISGTFNNEPVVNYDFECKCSDRMDYEGSLCEIWINDCDPNNCQNGGRCSDGTRDYTCVCPTFTGHTLLQRPYKGKNCDEMYNPCRNNGQLVATIDDYGLEARECECDKNRPYFGKFCANLNNPCSNGGTYFKSYADLEKADPHFPESVEHHGKMVINGVSMDEGVCDCRHVQASGQFCQIATDEITDDSRYTRTIEDGSYVYLENTLNKRILLNTLEPVSADGEFDLNQVWKLVDAKNKPASGETYYYLMSAQGSENMALCLEDDGTLSTQEYNMEAAGNEKKQWAFIPFASDNMQFFLKNRGFSISKPAKFVVAPKAAKTAALVESDDLKIDGVYMEQLWRVASAAETMKTAPIFANRYSTHVLSDMETYLENVGDSSILSANGELWNTAASTAPEEESQRWKVVNSGEYQYKLTSLTSSNNLDDVVVKFVRVKDKDDVWFIESVGSGQVVGKDKFEDKNDSEAQQWRVMPRYKVMKLGNSDKYQEYIFDRTQFTKGVSMVIQLPYNTITDECVKKSGNDKIVCTKLSEIIRDPTNNSARRDSYIMFRFSVDLFNHWQAISDLCQTSFSEKRLARDTRARREISKPNYNIGTMPGNAAESCAEWTTKAEKKVGIDGCAMTENMHTKRIQALEDTKDMHEYNHRYKLGIAGIRTGVAAGQLFVAGVGLKASLGMKSYEAAATVLDSLNTALDAASEFNDAFTSRKERDITQIEIEAQHLEFQLDELNECHRPSTATLQCGIGQLSAKVDILPAMDDKLDNLRVVIAIIDKNIKDIKTDIKDILSNQRKMLDAMDKIKSLVKAPNYVASLERLTNYYDQAVNTGNKDTAAAGLQYWRGKLPAHNKGRTCVNLNTIVSDVWDVINYLQHGTTLIESLKPVTERDLGMTEEEKAEWEEAYVVEFSRQRNLVRFGMTLVIKLHQGLDEDQQLSISDFVDALLKVEGNYKNSLAHVGDVTLMENCHNCQNGDTKYKGCTKTENEVGQNCKKCNSGYHLKEIEEKGVKIEHCEKNVCYCNHGAVATDDKCGTNGAHSCSSCHEKYHLDGNPGINHRLCEKNKCKCDHGSAVPESECTTHGKEMCSQCNDFYHLENQDGAETCMPNECKDCTHGSRQTTRCRNHIPGREECDTCHRLYKVKDHKCKYHGVEWKIKSGEIMIWEGNWGEWKGWKSCPEDYYVSALNYQEEPKQGNSFDDTALNGIEMDCTKWDDWEITDAQWLYEGERGGGRWATGWKRCPHDHYLIGVKVRSEDPNFDNTGLNALELQCAKRFDWHADKQYHKMGDGYYGDWKHWVTCPYGMYVCKMEMRYENHSKSNKDDDTGGNGLKMDCCGMWGNYRR